MKKLTTIFAVLFLCYTCPLQAQQVKGLVLDSETKAPLWGASIQVEGVQKGTISDSKGNFSLSNLPANTTLVVSFVGYEPKQISVTNAEKILLNRSNFLQDEVIVKATRADENSAMAFSDMGAKTLNKNNLGQDMPVLLQFTPSVVMTSDAGAGVGYTGIRIRGSDATRVNVTINGIPVNDSESQGTYWVNMPDFASSVQSVQIQRGVGTSTNGAGAFGGSVNMQTNEFKGPRKGDKGAGIPALPKPPAKPSVVAVPVTKPPKADAVKERDKWVEAGGTVTGGGAATGNPYMTNQTRLGNPNIRPGSLRDRAARANAERANGGKPVETAPWPDSGVGAAMKTSTGNNSSTGTATPPVVNKTTPVPPPWVRPPSKELVAANKQFVKQEAEYVKDDKGMNPEYKKAYLAGLEKYPPLSKSLQSQETSRNMAETDALRTAPRYASQTRTQNADGSATDRKTPTSVNNNPSATNSQANKEQQYVKKTGKPTDY